MKNTYIKLILLISAFFIKAMFTQQSFAQEMGTFFTTPEERAYLDFLRQEFLLNNQANDFNIDEVVPAVPVIEEEIDAPIISSYSLGGIFTRQDGSRTVWLNNANINESNLPANMRLISSSGSSTLLAIQLDSERFELRAGQTLDAVNGRVLESWQLPTPNLNIETPEDRPDTIESEIQPDNASLEPATASLAALDTEQVDPLPELEIENITAEEIRSIINSEDPAALTEFMQALQNFGEVQTDENTQ